VYSPQHHLLRLDDLTPSLIADNLSTQVAFARAVLRHSASSRWVSVNANQLPPSGSSIFHPHLQGSANPEPTTVQRLLDDFGPSRLREYGELERRKAERWIASSGRVHWLASFAPVGRPRSVPWLPTSLLLRSWTTLPSQSSQMALGTRCTFMPPLVSRASISLCSVFREPRSGQPFSCGLLAAPTSGRNSVRRDVERAAARRGRH
jgi:galactose-1-phosphate uridylyltransferase